MVWFLTKSKKLARLGGEVMADSCREITIIITVVFMKCVEAHFFFLKASGLVFLKSSVQFSVYLNDFFLSFPMTKLKN